MTEEYKKSILDYITNNVEIEPGNNVPLFDNTSDLQFSVAKTIRELLNNQSFVYWGYLFDEETQLIAIYGSYGTNHNKGFIYLCDSNLNTIQMITTFVNGSDLFPINDLAKDEDNKIYGISRSYDQTIRVLLLNNFFVNISGNYIVNLRNDYIVPNSSNYRIKDRSIFWHQKYKTILKVPGEATYFISLYNTTTNTGNIIRFTIIVGEENEWVDLDTNLDVYADDMLIEKNDSNIKLHYYTGSIYNGEFVLYTELLIQNDSITEIKSITTNIDIELVFAKNTNEIYIGGFDYVNVDSLFCKINNNNADTIFNAGKYNINVESANGVMCFYFRDNNANKSYVGILQDDVLYSSTPIDDDGYGLINILVRSYNLISLYVSIDSSDNASTKKYSIDYNPINYNGLPYSNYNKTKAVKGRLYSNEELVFARNLYNTTILNSTTTNTLNVPNTLLNDINIDLSNLISETNSVMVSKDTNIVKNIYENLFINFVNTLNVIDEDTNNTYPGTANYITQNINTGTEENCNNTFLGNVRINYSTPITKRIIWVWNEDHYETSYGIDTREEVPTTVDFISDDNTIYLTKEMTLESNKLYLAKQKLRIE